MLGGWIASAWAFFFLTLFLTWWLIPEDFTMDVSSIVQKYIFSITHIFLASLLLFIGFLAVGATRWQLETSDPTNNPAVSSKDVSQTSVHNRVHSQFLSNTTEQFVMFAAAVLAATPFITASYLRLITLVTILWILGRFFFWGGYWYTAANNLPTYPRAIGLGLGLMCTLSIASLAVIGICLHFPIFQGLLEPSTTTLTSGFSLSEVLIRPSVPPAGSNLLPIIFVSGIVTLMGVLAVRPKIAPPVIPMAIIALLGWVILLISGTIPIR